LAVTTGSEALARLVPEELREVLRTRPLVLQRPVWGRGHGRHRSARAGVGLDFRDHRPYVPGDDTRRLDWRAVARRDRLVLRQTEAEDELSITILLDAGGSMAYGVGRSNRMHTATAITGAFAWLASAQGDPIGVALGIDDDVDTSLLRPASSHDRMVSLARRLSDLRPSGGCPWDELIGQTAPRLRRRSLVIVLSDFLDPGGSGNPDDRSADEQMLRGLAHLRARGHDVVVTQLLHRDEVSFPWEERRMLKFLDLRKRRDPIEGAGSSLREAYLQRLQEHLAWFESGCEAEGLFLERLVTDQPLTQSFLTLLARLSGNAMVLGDEADEAREGSR
jgi:uncharacterized protein (DUF58 family)